MEKKKVSVVIVAAGRSTRMGQNKMLIKLGSMTVFERTLRAFEDAETVDEVVVVSSEENMPYYKNIVREKVFSKVTAIIRGGETRGESVKKGLDACKKSCEIILLHDGARPLIKPGTIDEVAQAAEKYQAAAVGVKLSDTLKSLDEEGFAVSTVDRDKVLRIQTPQGFKRSVIFDAYEKAAADDFEGTDDCSLTERLGIRTKIIYPGYVNIKLTSPEDLILATAVLRERGKL